MGFLDIGMWEVLLILVVALIIWGPGKLPEIARMLGRAVRALRKATFDLTATVTKEIEEEKDNPHQPRENSGDKTREPSEPSDVGKAKSSGTEMTSPRD